MPAFAPKRLSDIEARIRHVEDFLSRMGDGPTNAAVEANAEGLVDDGSTTTIITAPGHSFGEHLDADLLDADEGDVPVFDGDFWVAQDWVQGNWGVGGAPTLKFQVFGPGKADNWATAVRTVTTDTTVLATDGLLLVDAGAGPITVTMPTAVGHTRQYWIKKKDSSANPVTVVTTSGQTIDGAMFALITGTRHAIVLQSDSSNYWIVATAEPLGEVEGDFVYYGPPLSMHMTAPA